jgi:hypothetical protein
MKTLSEVQRYPATKPYYKIVTNINSKIFISDKRYPSIKKANTDIPKFEIECSYRYDTQEIPSFKPEDLCFSENNWHDVLYTEIDKDY